VLPSGLVGKFLEIADANSRKVRAWGWEGGREERMCVWACDLLPFRLVSVRGKGMHYFQLTLISTLRFLPPSFSLPPIAPRRHRNLRGPCRGPR
jgi:hypothetical protein